MKDYLASPPSLPLGRFLRELPAALKCSWFGMGLGVLLIATGYALRRESLSLSGVLCFVAAYAVGVADLRLRKVRREAAAGYYVGLTLAPVLSGYLHIFFLVVILVMVGIVTLVSGFDSNSVLRLLHFWGVSLGACIFFMLSKIGRQSGVPGRAR